MEMISPVNKQVLLAEQSIQPDSQGRSEEIIQYVQIGQRDAYENKG
jgi:hypothetical protein